MTVGLGLSDHRVPESDSGSAHWHTAAAMTVPQCGMGRGLTTDERAGTDTLSEAWLAFHWHKRVTVTVLSSIYMWAYTGENILSALPSKIFPGVISHLVSKGGIQGFSKKNDY